MAEEASHAGPGPATRPAAAPPRQTPVQPVASMATYASPRDYWKGVGPRLRAHLESQRDRKFEAALTEGVARFSFAVAGFSKRAARNQELLPKVTGLLVVNHDVVLSVLPAYVHLSPATLAALARIAFEAHVNFSFIAASDDPAKWADRYFRFGEVEKLLRAGADLPGDEALLPREQLESLRPR